MKIFRVVEVWNQQLQIWMMGLSREELESFCPASWSRYAAWDVYLNWLKTVGWTMRGILGQLGPLGDGCNAIIVLEGEDTGADPQIPAPMNQDGDDVLDAYLDMQVELDMPLHSPGHALVEALKWIRKVKRTDVTMGIDMSSPAPWWAGKDVVGYLRQSGWMIRKDGLWLYAYGCDYYIPAHAVINSGGTPKEDALRLIAVARGEIPAKA